MQPQSPNQLAPPASNGFDRLVQDLRAALGPSSGIDSADVDPAHLQRLMEQYSSDEQDWAQYALADGSRSYTRNLIDEGNGKCNLVSASQREHDKVRT